MTEEQVEDIEVSLDQFFLIQEGLPLTLLLVPGLVPVDLSIPVLMWAFTVSKMVCWLWDIIIVLKVGGKMNLFTVFLISATIQDGGK